MPISFPKKPVYIKISEDLDFFELFKLIENKYQNCYLIESLGQESQERFSVIGFEPEAVFSSKQTNLLEIKTSTPDIFESLFDSNSVFNKSDQSLEIKTKNAYFELQNIIPQDIISRNYSGGLFGFLSYEAYNFFQNKFELPISQDFGLFKFGLYTDGLVQDTVTGEIFYFYYTKDRSGEVANLIDFLKKDFQAKDLDFQAKFLGHSIDQKEHTQKVLDTIEHIKAGNSFQAEVGMKSYFEISGNPLKVYQKLRQINPSPFMFFCKFQDQIVLGASPELLLRLRDGELQTSPLAGTIRRGKDGSEDRFLARKLLNDPKEIAEHNMLVDMHRNDIGTVSRFGTVRVRNLMEIKRFSHVQHISSDVVGILDYQKTAFDALSAILPGGVVSGAPRLETVKIIHANEQIPRGVYGGALGHFGLNGNCTFTLPIRSLFVFKNQAYAQTSSGIVYDSDPQKEYQELIQKLAAMQSVLESLAR